VSWVLSRGGSVQGVAPANLAGRDGASGWGLKAVQVGARLGRQSTAGLV
jgi:histone-lysine N-methyltransferase SETD3